ncbi:condensation domain-containing protein, partial [Piscicoccus intestinalis]|uniref:condensation domain-containing protein n=1 Tax=Piscicoccus intestinalis TaxID=746033 RepID=UPI001FE1BD9F
MSIDTTPATAAEPTEPTELSEPTEPTQRPERPAPRAQVWPLAPLQEGLLYHAVSGEGGLDVYSMQSTYAFAPGTDLGVLERACGAVLDRHDALRAGFSATLLDRPVQFVPHEVRTPWRSVDLAGCSEPAARERLAAIEVSERQRRFDMDAPPLIRFVGVDCGPAGVHLVVTNHHIVLDGWSDALLVVELLRHIAAGGVDETLSAAPQFGRYLGWLRTRDTEADAAAWRRALSGLESGSLLAEPDPDAEAVFPDTAHLDLGPELTEAVRGLARRCAVSLNTVYSTLWGLLLRGLLGADDVVFGTTVSGRPADLPGVDEIVGLFLNTVPQRVLIRPGGSVRELLQQVQGEHARLVEHHHVGLGAIQAEAGVGTLFDTLYVMRNTPTDDASFDDLSARVGLVDIDGGDATHYPATFIVHPDVSTRLILSYRPDVLPAARARDLLAAAARVLRAMTDPDVAVGALPFADPR